MNYLRTGQFFGQTDQTIVTDGLTITDTQYTVEYVDWHYHENPYFTFIVVVITATAYNKFYMHKQVDKLIEKYLLPAVFP
jgi:hypothetical protein